MGKRTKKRPCSKCGQYQHALICKKCVNTERVSKLENSMEWLVEEVKRHGGGPQPLILSPEASELYESVLVPEASAAPAGTTITVTTAGTASGEFVVPAGTTIIPDPGIPAFPVAGSIPFPDPGIPAFPVAGAIPFSVSGTITTVHDFAVPCVACKQPVPYADPELTDFNCPHCGLAFSITLEADMYQAHEIDDAMELATKKSGRFTKRKRAATG